MSTPQPPGWQQYPPGWQQQPPWQQLARPPGHPGPPPGPPPKKRRAGKIVGGVLGVILLLLALAAGYLLLTYNRSVGAPPNAEPVPERCQVSGELLNRAGTPSWQSGPIIGGGGGRNGVECRWVAAEAENVRDRGLGVKVVEFESVKAAKKQLSTRAKGLGATERVDGVAQDARVWSSDGIATLVARTRDVVIEVEVTGADKSFFSGIFGDDVENEIPAAEAAELAVAVAEELFARVK